MQPSLTLHRLLRGKLEITPRILLTSRDMLSSIYTPGIASVVEAVRDKHVSLKEVSLAGRLVLVASNGTAVLGLGTTGSQAAYPVMEGKAYLFKALAGVDALPFTLPIEDPEEFARILILLRENYAAVNLEDIRAPDCFIIEERLREAGIPVMHDDQHGTAIVVLAGLMNALRLTGKQKETLRVALLGAGPAGAGIAHLLWAWGIKRIRIVDSAGILTIDRAYTDREAYKRELAMYTTEHVSGSIHDALRGADVLIGVSRGGIVKADWLSLMQPDPIIFALANPLPEVDPREAKAYARIIATGRSDDPNQLNNLLAFPGVFKGILESEARHVTTRMKIAAAEAIAQLVPHPTPEAFMPSPLDMRVHANVAHAVAAVWRKENEEEE